MVDGMLLPSFCEATERRGLIEEDNTLDECLSEATFFQMLSSLRRLFATILVFYEPNDVIWLWKKHYDAMSEDYNHNNPSPDLVQQMVLIDIRNMLQSMGKDIRSFPLLDIDHSYDNASHIPHEIFEEASIEQNLKDVLLCDSLNTEQRCAYDEIMAAVYSKQGGLFFVDGPDRTGKTFLYRALLAKLCSQDKLAVATATSRVAASIMPDRRTANSHFKIPLTIEEGGCCSFMKQSGTTRLLQQAALIIWDEASMTKRQNMEALDNSLWDIMGWSDLLFGGKTVVLGGDFRQVLPVVRKRIQGSNNYLLRIGGGMEEVNKDGNVRIPNEICVSYSSDAEKDLHRLISIIFSDLNANMADKDYITTRAILSTRNDWVDMINMKMIDMFQDGETVYHSFDSVVDDPHNYYPSGVS
ncbi:uncharacterized protein [Miscanthus floridulus]|uniref:uncharacterized protein n=1 Tax=Miscanthus floridulus TaxID=154761 RepID=UPI003457DC9C